MPLNRAKFLPLILLTLLIIGLLILAFTDYKIQKLIQEKRFLVPTQYYSAPHKFYRGQIQSVSQFRDYFLGQNYRERPFGSSIQGGDFSVGQKQQCAQLNSKGPESFACILYRSRHSKKLHALFLNEMDQITGAFSGDDFIPARYAQAEAELFAQYLGNQPTQQIKTDLGEIPRYCLDAVLAIEDPQFLEHRGISVRGIFRAIWANIKRARYSQGGSTITQQLVKNYFLTPEKTVQRKIKEILMALIFEFRVSKDQILETYLNIIYLGQSGVFEIRGYGSAASFYFQKDISQLNLGECSLLAAIVNSPGRYNPIRHPERASARRNRVLDKMLSQDKISQEELEMAQQVPLPTRVKSRLSASAPYYVDAVNKKLRELGINDRSGLNIFTALDPRAQGIAQKAVVETINYFENHRSSIKKIRETKKIPLQASLVASNPITGEVSAIVGGRHFASSPFNRAVDSQRQVGSVFKPIVYLTALEKTQDNQSSYSPTRLLDNSPFRLEYDRQVWEPQNYDKQFGPPVPLFFALKESKNVPTARLAMDVELETIITMARELGVQSPLKEFPSLSLGAFELKPMEVLSIYNTLGQMGRRRNLQIVKLVSNQRGDILYVHEPYERQVGTPQSFGVLVGMMQETLISGTGAASRKMGFHHKAAGKTGTTSDTKDAWFAGFTPSHSAVVWVGYDDGTPHGLTGASGALPIWTKYMKEFSQAHSNKDFDYPTGLQLETITRQQMLDWGIPETKAKDTQLLFRDFDHRTE